MSDNGMEQIAAEIRLRGSEWYPQHGEVRAVRIVGRTPKPDHYNYDLVVDFAQRQRAAGRKSLLGGQVRGSRSPPRGGR